MSGVYTAYAQGGPVPFSLNLSKMDPKAELSHLEKGPCQAAVTRFRATVYPCTAGPQLPHGPARMNREHSAEDSICDSRFQHLKNQP